MENEKGIVKLTRKQLYDEIWALSVAGVARKYNLNYGKLIATCKVENIPFPSSGYWTKKNMGKDVSNEIVEFSELGEFIDVPVKNYSSGMKSRLGFSIATIVSPKILILDEVLSVGDAKFRKKSEKKVMSMFDSGVTVLFVSHSLDQVKRICNKAMILDHGKLIAFGEIDDIASVYEKMIEEREKEVPKKKIKKSK